MGHIGLTVAVAKHLIISFRLHTQHVKTPANKKVFAPVVPDQVLLAEGCALHQRLNRRGTEDFDGAEKLEADMAVQKVDPGIVIRNVVPETPAQQVWDKNCIGIQLYHPRELAEKAHVIHLSPRSKENHRIQNVLPLSSWSFQGIDESRGVNLFVVFINAQNNIFVAEHIKVITSKHADMSEELVPNDKEFLSMGHNHHEAIQ